MSFILRIIIIATLALGIQFYFLGRLQRSIRIVFPKINPAQLKKYKWIFLLFANLYLIAGLIYLVYTQLTGINVAFPPPYSWFDYLIQFPFWVYIVLVFQSVLLFLLLEVIYFITVIVASRYKEKVKKFLSTIRLVLVLFFLFYVPARTYYDYSTVSTRIVEYKKSGLPEVLNGLKIVLIADVQADRYTNKNRLDKYIGEVNKTSPDLVLIAGDVITSTPDYIDLAAESLGKIKSKYGVYSCVGDHDNWAYRTDNERSRREITDALLLKNVKMIDNGKVVIDVENAKVGVTFITNTYVQRIDRNTIDTLSNHVNDEDIRIFLTHQPRQFLIEEAYKSGYDLFLAGHTHGGQLTFFFPFINLSPTLIETQYVKGDFRFGDMLAIVNRGLGMSLAPIRYNSTPEVTLIIISSK
jgi:hypothetical protein